MRTQRNEREQTLYEMNTDQRLLDLAQKASRSNYINVDLVDDSYTRIKREESTTENPVKEE